MRSALVLALLSLSACDALHARMIAREGVDLYRRNDVAGAAAKFEAAARLEATSKQTLLNWGFASLALHLAAPKSPAGEKAAHDAIDAFERYLALQPGDERASGFLVQTFIDTGRYD